MDTGTFALIFIIAARTFVPIFILRWPLAGMAAAIIADATDIMILEKFGTGPLAWERYHNLDKFFDTYYLAIACVAASMRWKSNVAKRTAQALFAWRFIGFAVFEISSFFGAPLRAAFVFAPNIFENFYLAWAAVERFFPHFVLTRMRLSFILFAIGIPKIIQEYVMHYAYTNRVWGFFREYLFWWLY